MSRIFSVLLFSMMISKASFAATHTSLLSHFLADTIGTQSELKRADFRAAMKSLNRQFDDICGDTFCEGEFGDIIPVDFDCVIDRDSKKVSQCSWLFIAYEKEVDENGMLTRHDKTFRCAIPLNGTLGELSGYLRAATVGGNQISGLTQTALPGSSGQSLYDALTGCL